MQKIPGDFYGRIMPRKGIEMLCRYYTLDELQGMKFYELPTVIYKAILEELRKAFGFLTKGMIRAFNNALVMELDQYINIYRFISIVA